MISGTTYLGEGLEMDEAFHNLCLAVRQGIRKDILLWIRAINVISKRQGGQRIAGSHDRLYPSPKQGQHGECL